MIRFFNVNNPSVIVFLFLYAALLNGVAFIFPHLLFSVAEVHEPFSKLFFQLTRFLFGNNYYALSVLAFLLIFAQALLLNSLINNIKLFPFGTYVPAMVYVLMASLFREFLFLTPALLANTFIILVLGKAVKFYRQHQCTADIFDMGMLIGAASLFYKPALLLLVLLFVALAVMRSFNWREWAIGISGFLVIYFLTGTWYFVTGDWKDFIQNSFFSNRAIGMEFHASLSLYIVGISTLALAVSGSGMFLFNFLKSAIHIRKFLALLAWTSFLLALSGLLNTGLGLGGFVVLSVPLSIVIGYLFMNIRRVRIANALHLIWLIAVLFFQYYGQ